MAAAGRQVLAEGDVLAGRYRLVRVVHEGETATLWQAVDEVLARPVALKAVAAGGRAGAAAARALLDAAGVAGGLAHPGLVRVLDAAVEEVPAGPTRTTSVAYVASEWVDGRDLHDLLAEGPLEPSEVSRLGVEAAEGLAAAHARGTAHGRLHPGNVLVEPSGRVRLTDTAVAAALAGLPRDPLTAEAVAADTRDLSAVLYAMLTARWPGEVTDQPGGPLPPAPRTGGRAYAPRQVRAGVPRALDAVVSKGLEPARLPAGTALTTPLALADALSATVVEEAPPPPPRVARGPSVLRRTVPWVAAVAFIAAFASGTYVVGKAIGELPSRAGDLEALVQATATPSRGAPAPARLDLRGPGVVVRDYDPRGDGREQTSRVVNATDGDPSTAWSTDSYRSAPLGGLKPGVGLLVDLGRPTAVSRVDLGLPKAGADVELRVGNALGADETPLRVVARLDGATTVARLSPPAGTTARYWLVWFTELPRDGDGFRSGVNELLFTR